MKIAVTSPESIPIHLKNLDEYEIVELLSLKLHPFILKFRQVYLSVLYNISK